MEIVINKSIKAAFPNLRLGCLFLFEVDNTRPISQHLESLATETAQTVRNRFKDTDSLSNSPEISLWRSIYKGNGSKPSKYRPTVESLIRRIIKGNEIPRINNVVMAYLLAELETLLPMGGYDLLKLSGEIELRHSPGNEAFVGIGTEPEETYPGEIVYSDSARILTRRWNFRDCAFAQITEESRDIALITEIPDKQTTDEHILNYLTRVKNLVIQSCGGSGETQLIK